MSRKLNVTVTSNQPDSIDFIKSRYGLNSKNIGQFCLDFLERAEQESDPVAYEHKKELERQEANRVKRESLEAQKRRLEAMLNEL